MSEFPGEVPAMKVTFLGTGTSQGVPVIACECGVCQSGDTRDNRLRTSVMLSRGGKNVVIDTGPDFRQQMLREKVSSLDGIVYTHEHKDHVAGMDDVRAFNYRHRREMALYGSERVEKALKREFHYAFEESRYPGVPEVKFNRIGSDPFEVGGITFNPIEVWHMQLPVQGFRVGNFAYITDANYIAPEELQKLKGTKVLVLNALRIQPHPSHFSLDEAIALIERVGPDQAWLTHISHLMGRHAEVDPRLPDNIRLAYDGLSVDV